LSQQTSHSDPSFDPCAIFPARIKASKFSAKPLTKELAASGAGGATDLIKAEAMLPTGNNAYARTIRLHEALHGIYSAKPSKERIKSKKGYTILEQALEDARLHLNLAQTSGQVRRDELFTALKDLHGITAKTAHPSKDVAALVALRSSAILTSQDDNPHAMRVKPLCERVAPDYFDKMALALEQIRANKMAEAKATLKPYFSDSGALSQSFPMLVLADEGEEKGEFADVSFAKLDGKITSDAADMLGKGMANEIRKAPMPKMYIHQMFANAMIPTFFGEDQKHVIAGCKIHAKKLATVIGPCPPRLFLKTIRRNGGTILIDASGSMNITPDVLIKMLVMAPAATIAFYNAVNDGGGPGNLWIFAHKGKRANDLDSIKRKDAEGFNRWGHGNVVDFQALQWLLAMPQPRYFLTDGEFTGPEVSMRAAKQLLATALGRKKLTQITSFKEMNAVLAKMGRGIAG